jgi:hypothetical protein
LATQTQSSAMLLPLHLIKILQSSVCTIILRIVAFTDELTDWPVNVLVIVFDLCIYDSLTNM